LTDGSVFVLHYACSLAEVPAMPYEYFRAKCSSSVCWK